MSLGLTSQQLSILVQVAMMYADLDFCALDSQTRLNLLLLLVRSNTARNSTQVCQLPHVPAGAHQEDMLLYSLGVYHEQSRLDRDTYVTIQSANVDPTKISNYNLCSA